MTGETCKHPSALSYYGIFAYCNIIYFTARNSDDGSIPGMDKRRDETRRDETRATKCVSMAGRSCQIRIAIAVVKIIRVAATRQDLARGGRGGEREEGKETVKGWRHMRLSPDGDSSGLPYTHSTCRTPLLGGDRLESAVMVQR